MPSDTTPRLRAQQATYASEHCVCFHSRRASRLLTQLYDEALRPSGLRATQFTLLLAIRKNAPVAVRELADLLAMDRTTLSRNLKPLDQEGLVTSRPGEDRRVREVRLSPLGHETLKEAFPLWKAAQAKTRASLGADGLLSLLDELKESVNLLQE